jgi:poly-gamma-glutamate synthesis protein (capsule biosynthesis protein)
MGTGTFEPDVVGSSAPAPLWSLGKFGRITTEASCAQEGGVGLTLARTPLSEEPALATTRHRVAAAQGQSLTVSAKVRYAAAGSRIEVHWYRDFAGPSFSRSRFEIPAGSWDRGACKALTFPVDVPRKAVAAQVFVVLDPPHGGQTVRRLAVDDLMLVDWAPKGRSGRRYDVIGALSAGAVSLGHDSSDTSGTGAAPLEP